MKKLPRILLATALTLTSQSLLANTSEERLDGWYQVHLAVFANRTGSGEYDEIWRNQLHLRYPEGLTRLKTRQRFLEDLCSPRDAGGNTENRLLDILERVDAGEGYPEDYREPEAPASNRSLDPACKELFPEQFPASADEEANARAEAAVESARSLLGEAASVDGGQSGEMREPPRPFILQDSIPDPEFADMVKKIRGAHRYRLLFSGSWPQKLNPRASATPILIQGGDPVGQHYELEGYIKVALERYLHIDTDLWLSDFGHGAAILQEAEGFAPSEEELQAARRSEFPALPTPFPVNDPNFRPHQEEQQQNQDDVLSDGVTESRPASNLDLLAANDSSYYVERTVVMRQNRRMRSGEVHYLDHPMFGVLVKITPLASKTDDKTAMR
ncbi:CsiV family protein [Litorivivens sp.]|uniref:CsiV family protein n=1 Tax=Litorivivens sp. TaxID=2020868 RepID=UPI0035678879